MGQVYQNNPLLSRLDKVTYTEYTSCMPDTDNDYKCERCDAHTSWYSFHFWHDYQRLICCNCITHTVSADGTLEICRLGDIVMIGIIFGEQIFTNLCVQTDIIRTSVESLNYQVLKEVNGWVVIPYEPPVIRKLKGRRSLNDLLPWVQARILDMVN